MKLEKKVLKFVKNLEIEDYSVQPHQDISPPKWHSSTYIMVF